MNNMTKEKKIEFIYEKVWTPIFMWNEYCWFDFCMVWYILDYLWDLKTEEIINNELQLLEIHKWWDGWNFFEIRDLAYCLDSILNNVIEIKYGKKKENL